LDVGTHEVRLRVGRCRGRAGHVAVKQQKRRFDPPVHHQLRYAISHLDGGPERGVPANRHRRPGCWLGRGTSRSAQKACGAGGDHGLEELAPASTGTTCVDGRDPPAPTVSRTFADVLASVRAWNGRSGRRVTTGERPRVTVLIGTYNHGAF